MKKLALSLAVAVLAGGALAQPVAGTHSIRVLTPEAAQKAVSAALASCRQAGYQVAVAVVDRSGVAQAMVRDRFAGAHTADVAVDKAWTAVSFRTSTAVIAVETQPGRPMSGLRSLPRLLAAGGGQAIEAAGSVLGAIGVSGAPTGEAVSC